MATVGTLTVALEADVEGLRTGLDKAAAQAEQAGRRIKAGLAPVREANEAVEKNLDLRARQQAAILEASRQVLAVEERIAQKEKDMGEMLVPKSVKEARERAKELRSAVEEMQAPLRAAQVPEEVIARMTQRFEEARRRLQAVTEQAKLLESAVDRVKAAAEDFRDEFDEALDDLILKGEDLKTVLRGLVKELQNILLQRLVREPVRRLADEIFGGLLSLGGSLLFGGGGAAPWTPPPGEAVIHVPSVADTIGRQFGGPLSPFQPAIVGEAGPELFIPRRAGTVIPNTGLQGGLAGATVYIDARGADTAELRRVERALVEMNASVERRAVGAVVAARSRDPRIFGPTQS